jgi:glyoxylase-like metal-dependent hydrolase (beta-lactamase superfamily II)
MNIKIAISSGCVALIFMLTASVSAQDFSNASIKTVPVADGLYMLMGQGGNIGVSVGADGVLLIDDQYAPMNDKIVAAIGAIIIAHDNVRKRMNATHFSSFFRSESPPSPPAALPVVTFDSTVTLHLNSLTIQVQHVPPAHTDGDSVIWFHEANVVHLGDTFFNELYPFIDVDSGGSIRGMISAIDGALLHINAATKIMPGHGPLADKQALERYRAMLNTVADRIDELIANGQSKQQVVEAQPTAEYDPLWGNGFIKPDQWAALVYDSLVAGQ